MWLPLKKQHNQNRILDLYLQMENHFSKNILSFGALTDGDGKMYLTSPKYTAHIYRV